MKLKFFFFVLLMSKCISNSKQSKGIICKFCEDVQKNVFDFYKNNQSIIISTLELMCKSKIYPDVCDYFLLREDPLINNEINFLERTNYICSLTFNLCDSNYMKYDFEKFRKNLYKNYKKISRKKQNKINSENKKFTVLTLNDVHLQKDYLYKSKVDCKGPSCCFEKIKESEECRQAGYWGTPMSKCDIPKHFWENTLFFIQKQEVLKTDFIILLGDNYGHNNYREKNSIYDLENYFYDSVQSKFPNSNIIPVFGNHEYDPVDFFDFDDKNNFVIKNLFPNLKKFINQEKIDNFINNGFYDLEFESQGVKFIIINSQIHDTKNFFLLKKHTNLLNFFEKLTKTIYNSEKKDQKVILLNHINLGNKGNYDGYEKNMHFIIERFSSTITTSLSGHTHHDEIRFIKNTKKEIIHVNYISPSLTTFGNYNPSFRVYKFLNGKVDDYDQYRFYIDVFNKLAEDNIFDFKFQRAYSFRDEYEIKYWEKSQNFWQFNKLLEKNKETQKKYLSHKYSIGNNLPNWEKESFFIKCQIMGKRTEQSECIDATNGGTSVFDLLDPERLYRLLFVRPWVVLK